jgi:peptidoglycan/xylan/chitin deacetylase (PgdA/CDA1 family)
MDPYHLGRQVIHAGMDHELYGFSALPTRTPLAWPEGARVAVVVCVAVEAFPAMIPAGRWMPPGHPTWLDVSSASLADYGSRVGFFRLAGILDAYGVPASVPVSDHVATEAPVVLEQAVERGWEVLGHGATADVLLTSRLTRADERALLARSREVIGSVTGRPPRGWTGPRMSESARTPFLAAEVGYEYVADWGNDDQPFPFDIAAPGGSLVSLPASVDLCDLFVMGDYAQTPWDFGAALAEHLAVLLEEAERTGSGRCMTVMLHAQHSGQAFRAKYVRQFLDDANRLPGVWFTTAGDLVDAFRASSVAEPVDRG